ncbi:hypothetical protein E5F05_02555 (plasmid) [Deinococcus metallilatus]|uniref:DUF885 domain-containing protein n=1 Tax=Deinococcus metallilatus TaxID=1211322 RepID=A0AAJ5F7K0_9DEIO|nr:hypothetical protein [Deinococcus metallilatus]MBB5295716.1 hypothetical protein [Deinococcus metallilatus]QBY06836.1 hypothetical protein E5F05_02555 [Deinococcus metallilatus]TLK32225.1 hypothetical protein FCS05_01885 [Deinococcus metallilatus]GMA14247.1 hypothetical protein GCM10025871_05780 [Deinococcus metallilatus]
MTDLAQAFDLSRQYAAVLLGADRAYRERPVAGDRRLEAEGLVPVHWTGLEVEAIDLESARRALLEIADRASRLQDGHLRDWLTEQAFATRHLLGWVMGEVSDFEQVVAQCLRIPPAPPAAGRLRAHQQKLDLALVQAGFKPGMDGLEAYREADQVRGAELQASLQALLDEARGRVAQYLPQLALHDVPIQAQVVSDAPFSAYCDYPGRKVWINGDFQYTRSALKRLVAHEAYPGHDVHMAQRERLTRAGRMPIDGAIVLTNSASSVLFEGIAELGLELIRWRTSPFDEIERHYNRLQYLCSIEAAHSLNTGRATHREAAALLRAQLGQSDEWIEARLRFFTHRLRAPFIYTYWWGNELAHRFWAAVPASAQDAAVAHLYDCMHSPGTLFAHWALGGEDE